MLTCSLAECTWYSTPVLKVVTFSLAAATLSSTPVLRLQTLSTMSVLMVMRESTTAPTGGFKDAFSEYTAHSWSLGDQFSASCALGRDSTFALGNIGEHDPI